MPIFKNYIKIKSGGTYLRVFTSKQIQNCMKNSYRLGHTPIVYLHPYELRAQEFWISWKKLNFLSLKKKSKWWLRQFQWLKLGHNNLEKKVEIICNEFDHIGAIRDNLKF